MTNISAIFENWAKSAKNHLNPQKSMFCQQSLKLSSLSWVVRPESLHATSQNPAHSTELDEYVRKLSSESDFGSVVAEKNKNKNRNFLVPRFWGKSNFATKFTTWKFATRFITWILGGWKIFHLFQDISRNFDMFFTKISESLFYVINLLETQNGQILRVSRI